MFIGMITSMVSHGPRALEIGPVCYGGAEEGTASKAWMYSKHVYESTILPKYCPLYSVKRNQHVLFPEISAWK
jgi:hypothetical protein